MDRQLSSNRRRCALLRPPVRFAGGNIAHAGSCPPGLFYSPIPSIFFLIGSADHRRVRRRKCADICYFPEETR
jgi:hypothetical protein